MVKRSLIQGEKLVRSRPPQFPGAVAQLAELVALQVAASGRLEVVLLRSRLGKIYRDVIRAGSIPACSIRLGLLRRKRRDVSIGRDLLIEGVASSNLALGFCSYNETALVVAYGHQRIPALMTFSFLW